MAKENNSQHLNLSTQPVPDGPPSDTRYEVFSAKKYYPSSNDKPKTKPTKTRS